MEPLSSISPVYDRGTEGLSGSSIFLWLTRILFTIAHTFGSPDGTGKRRVELLRTDFCSGSVSIWQDDEKEETA